MITEADPQLDQFGRTRNLRYSFNSSDADVELLKNITRYLWLYGSVRFQFQKNCPSGKQKNLTSGKASSGNARGLLAIPITVLCDGFDE